MNECLEIYEISSSLPSEMVVSIASVIVAACALGITIWQAWLTRKHNKLSVRPLITTIEIHDAKDNIGFVEFDLKNAGIGSAIIKSFVLLDRNEEISRDNYKKCNDFLISKTNGLSKVYTGYLVPGSALPAGEEHLLLSFNYDVQTQTQKVSFVNDINIVVEYQSIYQDEVFVYDSRKDRLFHGRETTDE